MAVPRLQDDIFALTSLFSQSTPSERLIQGTAISEARYGFGDASKAGFGALWERTGGIKYRLGICGKEEAENLSNWRELQNLVDALREEAKDGGLKGVEVFLFMDNSTTEVAFFNGSSKSRKLFELVLSLREMEIAQGAKIHFIHVSGKRMTEQGTDGLSRSQLTEGVMQRISMQSFIPLNETVLERSPSFKLWVEEWMSEKKVELLEPKDWFVRGHNIVDGNGILNCDGIAVPEYRKGVFIWTPPPVAAGHLDTSPRGCGSCYRGTPEG